MKASHRTALSLLLTIVIFTAICLGAVFGGFRYVEMHYYQPRVVNNITQVLDNIGSKFDIYADNLSQAFASYAMDNRSRTFIEREVTETDLESRQQMTYELIEKNPCLDGIRMVESDGVHVHYSTYQSDIFSKSNDLVAYRDYTEYNELPFHFVASGDNGEYTKTVDDMVNRCGIYLDSVRERIVFSFPYFDKYTAHRGTLLFYVTPGDFVSQIITDNIVPLNTRLKIVAPSDSEGNTQSSGNSGFVFGMPNVGRDILSQSVIKTWNAKRYGTEQLVQTEDNQVMILVTGQTCKYGKVAWICKDSEFTFSETEKILLLLCLFITLFLILFMLFNFRHDDSVVIRERVHKFEMALFREYLEHRDNDDWKALENKIALRKQDVNAEIVKSLGITGRKHSKEITEALDRSWNDFMHLVSGGYRSTLESLRSVQVPSKSDSVVTVVSSSTGVSELEEVEDLEEVQESESIDEVEELEEVEEITEAESVEEVEELDEAEDVEELDEVEDLEEVEELEDVEPLEAESEINLKKEKSVPELKTLPPKSDDLTEGAEELEEIMVDDDDLDVPEVEDFVDPLENDDTPVEVTYADELMEISPEEEAQLAQVEAQKKKSTWSSDLLTDDEMGTLSFDDLDSDDEDFWRE